MPILDTERRSGTRSALRYRPIDTNRAAPALVVSRARRVRPDVRVATAPAAPDELNLEEDEPARGRSTGAPTLRRAAPPGPSRRRARPLLLVGLGLVLALLLWAGIAQVVGWGTNEYNNIVYGYPRMFQLDAVVGSGDNIQHPSHFVALNLRGEVTILEFPAGDPGRARVVATTSVLGPNADQAVVTLHFVDLNHNGKPDMVIIIAGEESVLVNDQGIFRPPTSTEQQQILDELRQNGS